MAMNVNFKKGLAAQLPASRDANTFYYVTDTFALYLGEHLISNDVTLGQFNDLKKYVGTIPQGATSEDVVSYISEFTNNKIGTLAIGDETYDTVVDYVIAKTTGIATDTVVAGKADKCVPLHNGNIATLTTDGNLSDSGKTVSELEALISQGENRANNYTDGEIAGLDLALSDDGKTLTLKDADGSSLAVVDTSDFVVDGMLSSVAADVENNTLTFIWNTDSGIETTVIPLDSIADVYKGVPSGEISVTVSGNAISAAVGTELNKRIGYGETAHGWGDHSQAGYAIANDLGALATKDAVLESDLNSAVQTKLNNGDVAHTTLTSGTVSINRASGTTITITAFGKTSTEFTVPYAVTAGSTPSAGNADKLGNQLPEYYATAQSVTDINTAIGSQQTDDASATGIYASIQGSTTNTVKDCVDAINALNQGKMEANKNIEAITLSLSDVENQLTWGSF